MIERVYRQAAKAPSLQAVCVATDDERIYRHVRQFGGRVVMTDRSHQSGTDRCAEVAAELEGFDVVVNIQGDEPFLDPGQLEGLIGAFDRKEVDVCTLATPVKSREEIFAPDAVKVVFDRDHRALYFSRSPIPHIAGRPEKEWMANEIHYRHIGLYAFRRSTLLELAELKPAALEQCESLEQLRWLYEGYRIQVNLTDHQTLGIDRPEDVERAEQWLKEQKEQS